MHTGVENRECSNAERFASHPLPPASKLECSHDSFSASGKASSRRAKRGRLIYESTKHDLMWDQHQHHLFAAKLNERCNAKTEVVVVGRWLEKGKVGDE